MPNAVTLPRGDQDDPVWLLGDKEVAVRTRWPIRNKLLFGVALLMAMVGGLAFSAYQGVYAYRALARGISQRAIEMPLAADLTRRVSELRMTLSEARQKPDFSSTSLSEALGHSSLREEFRTGLSSTQEALRRYRTQLDETNPRESLISDNRREGETVQKIQHCLDRIERINRDEDWVLNSINLPLLGKELDTLFNLSSELPVILQERMHGLADDVRAQYHAWIAMMATSASVAALLLMLAVFCGYRWIFQPLRILAMGSQHVASGDFSYRIELPTQDEMGELAAAMNSMTERFQQIRDDLDHQVRERTKEVVRSEQLASVGFLAAGVAHEINNPLAAIAMCAESLESRVADIIAADDARPDDEHDPEVTVLRKYLRRIQDEAFRCKGITEKLLDYSRLGDVQKHNTDLNELASGVIEMVQHLGKYREKKIEFRTSCAVLAPVNAQEMKQVLLNLVTNGLDSLDDGGTVTVELDRTATHARIFVRDNGCGMTTEVQKHLFEPFFTRRKDGQGTGLGLSITYRIVQEHGGAIDVASDGPGCGSQFCVTLPLVLQNQQHEKRQAA